MEYRPLDHPEEWAAYERRRDQAYTFLKWFAFLTMIGICVLFIVSCASTPQEGRMNLAKTESAATAAFKEVTALATAGVIKKGSPTAVAIADAELAVAAVIRVWRTDPDNPKYIEAGVNVLPALIQLIADVKAGRK